MYIPRAASGTLQRLAPGFPVLHVTGPRQSGKTTLARHERPDLPYRSLENLDVRSFAVDDPRGFLAQFPSGAILDEVQRVPALLSYLQGIVDDGTGMGRFVLTGSQQPALTAQVSQSLAGRVGRVELLPLSGAELIGVDRGPSDLETALWTGGFPAIFDRDVTPTEWLANYTATYVERDVRQVLGIRDQERFSTFTRAVAARSAQLLNTASLGSDIGVSAPTVRAWISILQATYVVALLRPHSTNATSKLVKAPEVIVLDSGLMCSLIGIIEPAQLFVHPLRGAVFETWGIGELMKAYLNTGREPALGYLRDQHGNEIDCVVRTPDGLVPIEFKAGRTFASDWAAPMGRWIARTSQWPWLEPTIVYGGDESMVRSGVRLLSWHDFAQDPLGRLHT